jgi:hypothetical protein
MRIDHRPRRDGKRRIERWLYRGGHPHGLARGLNRLWAAVYGAGIWPRRLATLEVVGRRSGRTISCPVVIAEHNGERFLVAMLGDGTNWVRNARAAGGHAALRHGRREEVRLEEVDSGSRPAILRRYLACAPGARAHVPVDRNASEAALVTVAPTIPVFRITTPGSP